MADTAPALEALGEATPALAQLAAVNGTLLELTQAMDDVRPLPDALKAVVPLVAAIDELRRSVEVLNSTISPLQSTTERVGRLVDRLPGSRYRDDSGH